ncbi:hypothetical protein [Soonwooa sp.]|uniref:hypothetical protein n=1 Tax=Soonwooa sp. TaxID=1938592 RepID=UPI00261A7BA9|nr:hypothetical protein [Soonwooa sp.]
MKSQILSLALLGLVVISCSKNDKITSSLDDNPTASNQAAKTDSTNNEAATVAEVKTEVAGQPQVVEVAQAKAVIPSGQGLNPEHGMPGHRCDIPVGQPLNSTPVQAPQAPTLGMNPAPTVQQVTPASPQAIGPKPAVNPPHGEPHHDCAIPAGEPLT